VNPEETPLSQFVPGTHLKGFGSLHGFVI